MTGRIITSSFTRFVANRRLQHLRRAEATQPAGAQQLETWRFAELPSLTFRPAAFLRPRMKINILDAGIRHLAGHHCDYGLKLVRELISAGHDVHVYGASLMDDDVVTAFSALAPISKHFTIWPHTFPEKYDFYAGSFVQHRVEPPVIARDLMKVRRADLWIFPTILGAGNRGLRASRSQSACGRLRLLGPRELNGNRTTRNLAQCASARPFGQGRHNLDLGRAGNA